MLMVCLTILFYINIQQLLTDTYLTSSKLTIYPLNFFNLGNSMSNDVIHHGIDAADWSSASLVDIKYS